MSTRYVFIAVIAIVVVGCHEPQPPPTDEFERAETLLHAGDYDGAAGLYTDFLDRHPSSPLAPIARQRLRNIDRELEAVMGRRSTPAPIYIRPPTPEEGPAEADRSERRWGRSGP